MSASHLRARTTNALCSLFTRVISASWPQESGHISDGSAQWESIASARWGYCSSSGGMRAPKTYARAQGLAGKTANVLRCATGSKVSRAIVKDRIVRQMRTQRQPRPFANTKILSSAEDGDSV